MCNLGAVYSAGALDDDQYPDMKESSLRKKKLAEYWYIKAANAESVRAIYELGEMYYMFGQQDYEKAAVLYAYASGIEGEYAEKSLDRLFNMLDRHILKENWNCYPDVLYVLSEYSDHDVSVQKDLLDPSAELDNVTAESVLPEDVAYPIEVEEERRFGTKRSARSVLLSMGINPASGPNGICRIPYSTANKAVAEKMCEMGYNVSETKYGFSIRDRKKNRSRLDLPVREYREHPDGRVPAGPLHGLPHLRHERLTAGDVHPDHGDAADLVKGQDVRQF